MDLSQKPREIITHLFHLPITMATQFVGLKSTDQHQTNAGQLSTNGQNIHPDNHFTANRGEKSADSSIYLDYRHISLKEVDRIINFSISDIHITEWHRKCCVFCLQQMGASLPIGKTHAQLKAQYGQGMKKAYVQESKIILADNGFMKATACTRTKGIQYVWYAAEELEEQLQNVRKGRGKKSKNQLQNNTKLTLKKESFKPLQQTIQAAIQTAVLTTKNYYGFETMRVKKDWLINTGIIVGATLLLLNITPLINHAVKDSNAYYWLGIGGIYSLLYSITATAIWLVRTHVPVKIALGMCSATTLLSLPIHAMINNSGGLIGYQMVNVLFTLKIPEDVIVLLYGHLFLASTIPMGNPFFKLALQLKQLLIPLYSIAVYDPTSVSTHMDKHQYPSQNLDVSDNTAVQTLQLSHTDRDYMAKMQLLLDARDLNKTGNMIRVVDLINGLRTTVYIVQTSPRFNISDLEKQVKNMERSLGTKQINIIPSIEGKPSLSHIEVPKRIKIETLYLRDVLKTAEFQAQAKTAIPLGQDIVGDTVYKELIQFPHIAIAGTTGSGKSVQVNAMIISLMARNKPTELQFVMIDPKMLELSIYKNSPYLSLPVITHMEKAKGALEILVNEMEYRYALLSALKVRNIKSYNNQLNTRKINSLFDTNIAKKLLHPATKKCQKLPLIVCVIDEMADLILQYGKEVEVLMARIAQKSRAAGIHLILATQRPDKEVMTGLIKANIPSRIALSVDSTTNSRIILDQKGAEKLLGKGDMLIKTAEDTEIIRAQGYFMDEKEITQFLEEVA